MLSSRHLLIATLYGALAVCPPVYAEQPFVLTIAHMNDTHSKFDPVDATLRNPALVAEGVQNGTVYTRLGGYPRLLSMTKSLQADAQRRNQAMLTLHGGDAWQGSGYFKLNEGMANADLLNQFGFDAMVLGNHEFDLNNQKLARFIQAVNFPMLAANMDASQEPVLSGIANLKPFVLFAFDGNQKSSVADLDRLPKGKAVVAVVGLLLEDMSDISPTTGKLRFAKEVASAQATVELLKSKGVSKVVLLTHLGNQRDLELAAQVNGIDVIVGGHSHSLLGDFSNVGMGKSTTRYAQMVSNPDGIGRTCVVQAGSDSEAVGKVQVSFAGDGRVSACAGKNTLLASNEFYGDASRRQPLSEKAREKVIRFVDRQGNLQRVDEDIRLRAFVDIRYKPTLEKAYGQVIASVPGTLINPRRPGDNKSGIHGSEVAPLVSESQFWWANSAPVQALLGKRVDFALTSVGGVRTEIAAGEWREGEAGLTLLPFKNPLTVLTLRGSDVRALISETVTATLPAGSHAGKFPYGSRLRYVFQETVANKQGELVQLDWQDQNGQWQPIRDDVRYRVVMNAYCANGNDGWDALFRAQQQAASERVDLAWVDGALVAFPVDKISRRGDLVDVHYQGSTLDCAAKGVSCSTDAAAFTGFVREARNPMVPLQDKVVTLQRSR